MKLTLRAKATIAGAVCAIIVGLFTIVLWPLLLDYLRTRNAGSSSRDSIQPQESIPAGKWALKGSRWEGAYQRYTGNRTTPSFDLRLVILVTDRSQNDIEFECWFGKDAHAALFQGTIDASGQVEGKFVKILKGRLPGLTPGEQMEFGRIEGKRWLASERGESATRSFDVRLVE